MTSTTEQYETITGANPTDIGSQALMPVADMSDKVAVFIDFDNMYKGFREAISGIPKVFIDFREMDRLLANGRYVACRKAFDGKMPGFELPEAFQVIGKAGYELITENCERHGQ